MHHSNRDRQMINNNDLRRSETANRPIERHGVLGILSATTGLIHTADNKYFTFKIKDFCDQRVDDLTEILHLRFTLKFIDYGNEAVSHVIPLFGDESETIFANSEEVDTSEFWGSRKDDQFYSKEMEKQAYRAITEMFVRDKQCIFGSRYIHNGLERKEFRNDQLFRYVGTFPMKRRDFFANRSHLFRLQKNGRIDLQYPAIYTAVTQLSSRLLRRGGVTSIQSLYEFYLSDEFNAHARNFIGNDQLCFMGFLTAHPFFFAVFPKLPFVSARRNLPELDYRAFIEHHFPSILEREQRIIDYRYPLQMPRIHETTSRESPNPLLVDGEAVEWTDQNAEVDNDANRHIESNRPLIEVQRPRECGQMLREVLQSGKRHFHSAMSSICSLEAVPTLLIVLYSWYHFPKYP
uniref:Lin-66-like winged helix domain-containing protein n=1 Tax=Caenorhabditis tropicalis TaxID=1561998 RepID=A0A1I7TGM9_9PELO